MREAGGSSELDADEQDICSCFFNVPYLNFAAPRMTNALDALRSCQKTVSDNTILQTIVSEYHAGSLSTLDSLRKRTKALGISSTLDWHRRVWIALLESKSPSCTDIVKHDSHDTAPGHDAPTRSHTMSTMQKYVHASRSHTAFPISPLPDGYQQLQGYDRNDLYLTAADLLTAQLNSEHTEGNNISIVALLSNRAPKYVTWCTVGDKATLLERVNRGDVVCNDATTAWLSSNKFSSLEELDYDIGRLAPQDVDGMLMLLETYTNYLKCRAPSGLNLADTVHVIHRDLEVVAGRWDTLTAYTRWVRGLENLQQLEKGVTRLANEVQQSNRVIATQDDTCDEIVAAMESERNRQEAAFRGACKGVKSCICGLRATAATVRAGVIDACAVKRLNDHPVPIQLTWILGELQTTRMDDASNHMETLVEEVRRSLVSAEVGEAMRVMGITETAELTSKAIAAAYNTTLRRNHADKNMGVQGSALPEQIRHARDVLNALVQMSK